MGTVTVLLRGGATLFWVEDGRRIADQLPLGNEPSEVAAIVASEYAELLGSRRKRWAERSGRVVAEPALARAIRAAGGTVEDASVGELRAARRCLPDLPVGERRRFLLPIAEAAARRALSSPEETLIALAREEARLERALGRERSAQSQWVAAPVGPLGEHALEAAEFAKAFARHHAELEHRIAEGARSYLPNLSQLLGPKVAARLLAAAGSRRTLARISAARLQLLGSRKRPDPQRGPRFGIIYRAPGLEELTDERRGRFARSVAALAVIAARADAVTGADLSALLIGRRDRRWAALKGGRS